MEKSLQLGPKGDQVWKPSDACICLTSILNVTWVLEKVYYRRLTMKNAWNFERKTPSWSAWETTSSPNHIRCWTWTLIRVNIDGWRNELFKKQKLTSFGTSMTRSCFDRVKCHYQEDSFSEQNANTTAEYQWVPQVKSECLKSSRETGVGRNTQHWPQGFQQCCQSLQERKYFRLLMGNQDEFWFFGKNELQKLSSTTPSSTGGE